jgi:plastocyanin
VSICRRLAFVVALSLVLSSCGSIPFFGSSGTDRRVLVDFKHDEFGASFLNYFPTTIRAHAGDTIQFRQMWGGEAHTVTMGTLIDTLGKPYWELLDEIREDPEADFPAEAPDAPGFSQLPTMLDPSFTRVIQAAAQPCFRETWVPDVSDFDEPCPKVKQPAFNGRQAYYSSGFIPFEGPGNNEFIVPLADDILEGTYHFYCTYHGPAMSGAIEIVDESVEVPNQTDVNRRARDEAQAYINTLEDVLNRQRQGRDVAPLPAVGGYPTHEGGFNAFHNEYVPDTLRARVGEKVTWSFYGGHTLSFNVPEYFPVFTVNDKGFVAFNPDAFNPVVWPGRPEQEGPRTAVNIDAGAWDGGGGLHSSGWDFGHVPPAPGSLVPTFDTFSITFTRPGDYPFACLLHPSMVGKVIVE